MRKYLLIPVSLLVSTASLFAQSSRTFNVEKLSPPKTKVFATDSYQTILERLIVMDRQLTDDPNHQVNTGSPDIIAKSDISQPLITRGFHSFFEGIYAAYADHHPVTLSPDMIWLLISQGFANHVINNAEELRGVFVNFNGKKTLTYVSTEKMLSPNSPWDKMFAGFGDQITQNTNKQLTDMMTANFTTTSSTSKIASQITLMKSVQPYFRFVTKFIGCGIPKITLQGTTKDWESVLAKTEALRQYKLDWWVDELEPILKQFIAASKGNIDKQFWQEMFKYHTVRGCGSPTIADGWISKFYPYDRRGLKTDFKGINIKGESQPNEILKVDLDYVEVDKAGAETHTPLELWAGFVGLEQDSKTYGLTPRIGWMVRKKDPFNQALIDRLTKHNEYGTIIILSEDAIPPELFKIGPITSLEINCTGNSKTLDKLSGLRMGRLILHGKITTEEVARIAKMFPDTKVSYLAMNNYPLD